MERKNHVEDLLNELRSEKCYDAGRVAQESANTWSAAAREGRIYNKIFAAVPLVLIHIDDTYQRTENFSKAKGDHIAANFSEGAYEAVKLNYRDGAFYCPSGQHRVYAHIAMKREYIVAELSKMSWKEEVAAKWDSIQVVSMDKCEELRQGNVESGKDYIITCVVDEKGLNDAVGVEMVVTYTNAEGKEYIYSVVPMELVKREGNLYTFKLDYSISNAGSFKVAYRMYPKNIDLPHRQDFCYVRWFNE